MHGLKYKSIHSIYITATRPWLRSTLAIRVTRRVCCLVHTWTWLDIVYVLYYLHKLVTKIIILNMYGITVVSWASAHSRVSAHVPNFKGSLLQLPYKHMEFISRVSAHAGQNCELCLSAHGRLPGTLRYVHVVPCASKLVTQLCIMHNATHTWLCKIIMNTIIATPPNMRQIQNWDLYVHHFIKTLWSLQLE